MAELLHELLPRLREERGLSQNDLSHITARQGEGVPVSTIQSYEKRANVGRMPKAKTLEALASALGVPPSVFYEWPIADAKRRASTGVPATAKRVPAKLKDAARQAERRPASPAKRRAPDGEGEAKK